MEKIQKLIYDYSLKFDWSDEEKGAAWKIVSVAIGYTKDKAIQSIKIL